MQKAMNQRMKMKSIKQSHRFVMSVNIVQFSQTTRCHTIKRYKQQHLKTQVKVSSTSPKSVCGGRISMLITMPLAARESLLIRKRLCGSRWSVHADCGWLNLDKVLQKCREGRARK